MNELVQQLIAKTGLPEAQATLAAQTVVAFLKERLPTPIASQLDGVLGGSAAGDAASGGIGSALGGLFGKK